MTGARLKWTQTNLGDRPDCDACLMWMIGQPGLAPRATVDRYHADGHHDVAGLTAERDEARARANEAARLSAEARDQADDLRKLIADLREQVAIIDESRTEMTVIQLRLEQERDKARAELRAVAEAAKAFDAAHAGGTPYAVFRRAQVELRTELADQWVTHTFDPPIDVTAGEPVTVVSDLGSWTGVINTDGKITGVRTWQPGPDEPGPPAAGTLPWLDTDIGGRILAEIGCTPEQVQEFGARWEARCWPILAQLVAERDAVWQVYVAADQLVGDWEADRTTHGGRLREAVTAARPNVTTVEWTVTCAVHGRVAAHPDTVDGRHLTGIATARHKRACNASVRFDRVSVDG